MTMDTLDKNGVKTDKSEITLKMNEMNRQFASAIRPESGYFSSLSAGVDKNITAWLNTGIEITAENRAYVFQQTRNMFSGTEIGGKKTLGLDEISTRKINPNYAYSNMRQHAGFSAEVISTAKENITAKIKGTGITAYRTDDLAKLKPELGFSVNDQFVDKVRLDANGKVLERVQTKFVGKNPKECLSKLASKKFEKYLDPSKVDKLEVPADYYDKIKNELLPEKINSLENQVEKVKEIGNEEAINTKQAELDKFRQIDSMLEKSTVTVREAEMSFKHPKIYKAKMFAQETAVSANEAGKESAIAAAKITLAVSTVDNMSKVFDGEADIDEAIANIVTETGISAVLGYGTGAVKGALSTVMTNSSHQLIKSAGNLGFPAAAVSFAVESFDEISAYTKGKIDEYELAEQLGGNAAKVAGGTAGEKIGAVVGNAVVPGVGMAVGGIVGGMVGCALASEAYQTLAEYHAEGTEILADKAKELASGVIDNISEKAPQVLDDVKSAFTDFASNIRLPFALC